MRFAAALFVKVEITCEGAEPIRFVSIAHPVTHASCQSAPILAQSSFPPNTERRMNIIESTAAYETALSDGTKLDEDGLKMKRAAMAKEDFSFLRATYYRWVELFEEHCADLADSGPLLLGVGDLHVQNFGTWRDSEGRLVWGVDDFDEADEALPMASDLVRLAVSAVLSVDVQLSTEAICSAILEGYEAGLSEQAAPFVLENGHDWLRDFAFAALKPPEKFWKKWLKEKTVSIERSEVEADAIAALAESYPAGVSPGAFRMTNPENPKGLGSLGRQRFFAYNADWQGGPVAREAKAAVPPATRLRKNKEKRQHIQKRAPFVSFVQTIQSTAIRSPDPVYRLHGRWVCKAIMANTGRIEMEDLANGEARERLLRAMGQETANVQRGTAASIEELAEALKKLQEGSLRKAVDVMASATIADAALWKKHWEVLAAGK